MFSLFKSNINNIWSACHSKFHYQLFLNEMTVPESTKNVGSYPAGLCVC